jgi:hypothetical protein
MKAIAVAASGFMAGFVAAVFLAALSDPLDVDEFEAQLEAELEGDEVDRMHETIEDFLQGSRRMDPTAGA